MTAASLQRVLGRQDLLYGKLVQQCLRIVYGLRFSLVLVVAHDDPAAEFAVFGQLLVFVADVVIGSIVLLRAVKRIADVLDAGNHPKVLVDGKAGQADHLPSLVQPLRVIPVLVLFASQNPFGIEHVGIPLELLGRIVAVVIYAAADVRPTDFLIGEVEQVIKHNIVAHASSIGASALVVQGFESGYRYERWIIRESY